jgi:RNA polymerase subunit RPABC4/transcription elongation factor Spt4
MQQSLTCPSCGSPLASSQKFCGVCGLNLAGMTQQQINACPTCGSTMPPGQQFCAVCGTRIGGTKQRQQAVGQQAAMGTPAQTGTTSTQISSEPATTVPSMVSTTEGETMVRPHKHRILTIAGVIFQIFGWIVLVFGILASIAMAVFAAIGGTFMPAMPGLSTIGGMSAILIAIGGIIASLLYGFGLLAFAEICYTVRDIDERVTGAR